MHIDSTCTGYPLTLGAGHAGRLQRLVGWWRGVLRQRERSVHVESMARLGKHLLGDIGVSEETASIARARNESHYERFARSSAEMGGTAGRFGF
jgi:uncharacterized protein YjiS (DUF1127 family)